MEETARSQRVRKVQAALDDFGIDSEVRMMEDSARSALEAAEAIGCRVEQIAKSIVMRAQQSGRPVLVLTSGSNRVDESRIADTLGEQVAMAGADFVRETTGFAIGGVAPVAHRTPPVTYLDRDLFDHDIVWAAAGHPRAVFPLEPQQLQEITGGEILAVA